MAAGIGIDVPLRMEIVDRNPCDRLERPRTTPSPPRGLSALEVQKLLAAVPATRIGLRNRAILLTLLLTGRRRAEVFRLTRGDLSFDDDVCFYSYRGKGGKTGRRELPVPAVEALRAALRARDLDLEVMKRPRVFMGRHERYVLRAAPTALPGRRASPAGIHILRHTAAKLRRDAGESIEDVSRFLDHTSLAVTTTYLRRLEGQEDHGWGRVAEAIGV